MYCFCGHLSVSYTPFCLATASSVSSIKYGLELVACGHSYVYCTLYCSQAEVLCMYNILECRIVSKASVLRGHVDEYVVNVQGRYSYVSVDVLTRIPQRMT